MSSFATSKNTFKKCQTDVCLDIAMPILRQPCDITKDWNIQRDWFQLIWYQKWMKSETQISLSQQNIYLQSSILSACNDSADQCSNGIQESLFSLSVQAADLFVTAVPYHRVTVQSICHMGLDSTAGTLPRAWWTSHITFSLDQNVIIRQGCLGHTIST